MENEVAITIEKLSKEYSLESGENIVAVQDISFSVEKGECVSIIGPSGCGKSTLIKMIAGLIEPTSGKIIENNELDLRVKGNRGVVSQHYSLFPWLSVGENIGFGLQVTGASENKTKKIVAHYVEVMGLGGFEKAYPKELSGGMQQRASLARTLATNPKMLLMDEPFSALDVETRKSMQDVLLQLLHQEPRAAIFVTHDVDEAIFLSDAIYIMTQGPGTIVEKVRVNLPRERNLSTECSENFIGIKKHIQTIINKETRGLTRLDLEMYKDW